MKNTLQECETIDDVRNLARKQIRAKALELKERAEFVLMILEHVDEVVDMKSYLSAVGESAAYNHPTLLANPRILPARARA